MKVSNLNNEQQYKLFLLNKKKFCETITKQSKNEKNPCSVCIFSICNMNSYNSGDLEKHAKEELRKIRLCKLNEIKT